MKRKLSKFEHVGGPRVVTLDCKLRNEIRVLNEVIIIVQDIYYEKRKTCVGN